MKRMLQVTGLLALALVVGGVLLLTRNAGAQADDSALKGKAAPEISLSTLDGKAVKLSEQKGSVVVLDFWATWCPPCRKSLPHLQHVSADKALAEKGLKVWAVNLREEKPKIQGFMDENKFTFAVPLDTDGAVAQKYGVRGIPTTVIVGRDGTVKNVFVGYGGDESAKQMDDAINAALAEKAE